MIMNKHTEEFLNLVKENPDLPILPMVWNEVVCGNDSFYWGGSFGMSEIRKVYLGGERWHFYLCNDIDEQIDTLLDRNTNEVIYTDYYKMEDAQIKQEYDELPWKEYIVVYIELPD